MRSLDTSLTWQSTNQAIVTERARKLRAQYALQANDLRARIERRVNRIPVALRKATMGELLEKHMASLRAQQANPSPRKLLSPAKASRSFRTVSVSPNVRKASAASPSARRVKKQRYGMSAFNLYVHVSLNSADSSIQPRRNLFRQGKRPCSWRTARCPQEPKETWTWCRCWYFACCVPRDEGCRLQNPISQDVQFQNISALAVTRLTREANELFLPCKTHVASETHQPTQIHIS